MKKRPLMNDAKNILVLLLAGAGDTLMSTPFLAELRKSHPDSDIDVMSMQGKTVLSVLENNPNITSVIDHDFLKESPVNSLLMCLKLRMRRYDYIIAPMPHNRFAYNMIAFLLGGKKRIGFRYDIRCGTCAGMIFHKLISEDTQRHMADNNLRIITEGLGLELSDVPVRRFELYPGTVNKDNIDAIFSSNDLEGRKVIAMHAGSGVTKNLVLKRWGTDNWAKLSSELCKDDSVRILLLGGSGEHELKQEIIDKSRLSESKIIALDDINVCDAAELISRCEYVVSCDTLVPHIAAAVNKKSIVIYGPTSHIAAAPYNAPHRIVRAGVECSPCYGYSKYGVRCTNEVFLKCLKDIDVDMVMAAIRDLQDLSD